MRLRTHRSFRAQRGVLTPDVEPFSPGPGLGRLARIRQRNPLRSLPPSKRCLPHDGAGPASAEPALRDLLLSSRPPGGAVYRDLGGRPQSGAVLRLDRRANSQDPTTVSRQSGSRSRVRPRPGGATRRLSSASLVAAAERANPLGRFHSRDGGPRGGRSGTAGDRSPVKRGSPARRIRGTRAPRAPRTSRIPVARLAGRGCTARIIHGQRG